MKKKEYVYFLIHKDGMGPPLSFYGNYKEAQKDAKRYGATLVKHEIKSKRGNSSELRSSRSRVRR